MFDDLQAKDDLPTKAYIACKQFDTKSAPLAPGSYKVYYQTFPIIFTRPDDGERRQTEVCRLCRKELVLTVRSKPSVARKRLRRRLIGAAALLFSLLVLTLVLPGTSGRARDLWTFVVVLSAIGGGLTIASAGFNEFNLALSLKYKGETEHKLFETIDDKLVGQGFQR